MPTGRTFAPFRVVSSRDVVVYIIDVIYLLRYVNADTVDSLRIHLPHRTALDVTVGTLSGTLSTTYRTTKPRAIDTSIVSRYRVSMQAYLQARIPPNHGKGSG